MAEILATYSEIDTRFSQQFDAALDAGDLAAQSAITAKRVLTDNAFFVLLWGQLENEINDLVDALVAAGNSNPSFATRRLHYNLDPDRIKFEDRLALVTDKRAGAGSAWSKAIRYYGLRNTIAYGNSNRSGVSVSAIVNDLYFIQSQFQP